MAYKALIVDDNKVARVMLTEMLKKVNSIEIAGEFESALSAIDTLKSKTIDILFLDVEMEEMSGIDLLRLLPERPLTILVTAQPGYAAEAFELNVVDYLVKPFSLSRVMMAVEKATELLAVQSNDFRQVENNNLFIKDGKTIRSIMLEHILWLEAKGDYVKIVTQQTNYIIHSTLRNLEEKLSSSDFVRIHRGYVIPVGKIDSIEDGAVYIQGTALPLSESYKLELLKKLKML